MFQRYFNTVASLGIALALIARAAVPMGMAPAQAQAPSIAGAFEEICTAHAGHDAGTHASTPDGTRNGSPNGSRDGRHGADGGTCHHCILCQIARPAAAAPVVPVAVSGPRGYTPVAFHAPDAARVFSPTLPFRPGPRAPPIPS